MYDQPSVAKVAMHESFIPNGGWASKHISSD